MQAETKQLILIRHHPVFSKKLYSENEIGELTFAYGAVIYTTPRRGLNNPVIVNTQDEDIFHRCVRDRGFYYIYFQRDQITFSPRLKLTTQARRIDDQRYFWQSSFLRRTQNGQDNNWRSCWLKAKQAAQAAIREEQPDLLHTFNRWAG